MSFFFRRMRDGGKEQNAVTNRGNFSPLQGEKERRISALLLPFFRHLFFFLLSDSDLSYEISTEEEIS